MTARFVRLLLLALGTCAAGTAGPCGDFQCPAGFRRRDDAGEVDPTEEQCCQRLCSSFKCPSVFGYLPSDDASSEGRLTLSVCCHEAPSCLADSRYVPLGQRSPEGLAASSIECAQRCQATAGCVGFSWLADSSCHLANANAVIRSMPGGVSGNQTCHSPRPAYQGITGPQPEVVHEHCQRQPGRCTGKTYQLFLQEGPRILRPSDRSDDTHFQLKHSGVAIVDWDGDGDLDVVTSDATGQLDLFLQGSEGKLSQASSDNPFRSIQVGRSAKPSVFDWDGDGELDVLVGNAEGDLKFLKGSGNGAVAMTWNWYPFSTLKTSFNTAPAIADINSDGLPDLVLGHGCQLDLYLGHGNHSLTLTASYHGFLPGAAGCSIVPTVWDWDGDGVQEVIVGDHAGKLYQCRFLGNLTCEAFQGYGAGKMASPAACDWDSDGVPDLIVQSDLQDLAWFRRGALPNALEAPHAPALHSLDVGEDAVPVLVDWDQDGDLDLIVGSADGKLWYFPQRDGKFESANTPDGPFADVDVGSHCAPAAVDWDSDGFPDLVLGNGEGRVFLLRGRGSAKAAVLEEQSPFASVDLKKPVHPAMADWDHDGDLDLLALAEGHIQYFRNEHGKFTQVPESSSPFSQVGDVLRRQGLSAAGSLCLQAMDVDSDGDWDLVVGAAILEQLSDGTLKYVTASDHPFPSSWSLLQDGPPCLTYGDLDMDGIPDLAMGFKDGRLDLGLRKASSASLGTPQLGHENPLISLGLPEGPKSAGVVDWNLDGLLDLVVASPGAVRLFLRQADGSLKEETADLLSKWTSESLSIVTADWTMDGADDLILFQERGLLLLERRGSNFLPPVQVLSWPDDMGTVVGGAVADWDSDGRLDILAGLASGKLLYWHQDKEGKLQLLPEDESSFAEINFEGPVWPAVADMNADGKPDLVLGVAPGQLRLYLQEDGGKLVSRHTLDGFQQHVVPVIADWNGDGGPEVILGTDAADLPYLEQRCELTDACFSESGLCSSKSQVCQCLPGHAGVDCSKCAPGFSATPRNSESGHSCYPCPSAPDAGICYKRGVCVDDNYVQTAALLHQKAEPWLLRGNGSCLCNPNFFGEDCGQGACPRGQEPTVDLTFRSTYCRPCQSGFGKEESGNHACIACPPGTASSDSGLCVPCADGLFQALSGQGSCSKCEAGQAPSSDGTRCKSCPPGTSALPGDRFCKLCGLGQYQPSSGQGSCIPCSAGSQTDMGQTSCSFCPSGTMAVSGECQQCPAFTTSSSSGTQCVIGWASLVGAVVFTLLTLAFFNLLVFLPGVRRNIADITWSVVDEAVIVTMQSPHHFGPKLLKVRLQDVGVPWLDPSAKTPHFFVKKLSHSQLQLFSEPKIALTVPTEASRGTLKPAFMAEALGTVLFGFPICVWLAICALGMILIVSLLPIPWWYLLLTVCLAFAVTLGLQIRRARHDSRTPLHGLLCQFQEHLHTVNPQPASCDPGAQRALSVGQILHFNGFFRSLIQHRNMYYVCPSIIKPLTKTSQLSFAELAGCGMVDWFISHFWGLPFKDFAQSLRTHAMYVDGNWEKIRYWICAFSQNQWRLSEEMPPGALRESSFHKALMAPSCQGTGLMMDLELTPLTRSWCLFEMLQTFNLHERGLTGHRVAPFLGLFMLTPSGVLNVGRGNLDTTVKMVQQLPNLRFEDASAAAAEDQLRIDEEVRAVPGGFAAVNCKLRAELRLVLEQTSLRFGDDLNELTSQLFERQTQEVEIQVSTDAPEGDTNYCSWTG